MKAIIRELEDTETTLAEYCQSLSRLDSMYGPLKDPIMIEVLIDQVCYFFEQSCYLADQVAKRKLAPLSELYTVH